MRLDFYIKRKKWLLEKMEYDRVIASNKKRFIEMQLEGSLVIQRRDILEINTELRRLKFTPQAEITKMLDNLEANVRSIVVLDEDDGEEDNKKDSEKESEFDYLMNMPIKSFTAKKIRDLKETLDKIENEIAVLS